jgi:CheY-like chemotaxis protein
MDLMMPDVDGLEATRRLKSDARTQGIPILALTGDVSPLREQAARLAGCDDFVAKPLVFPDLVDRIQRHVDG